MKERKPEWLRVRLSDTKKYNSVNEIVKKHRLNTVCDGANCPNRVNCYSKKTATFMILGAQCTRNCRFCNIEEGTLPHPDKSEPERVGLAVKELCLRHAVVTSVTRDDLPDGGATMFAETISAIRRLSPETIVEVLIPDMQGVENSLDVVMAQKPEIINHNIETVPRLYADVRPQANYKQSLDVLRYVKTKRPDIITKSGLMVGLGETEEEVKALIGDLAEAKVDMITIGQYLQPSKEHFDMAAYIHPDVFDVYKAYALSIGIRAVASGPLVRSSYYAKDLYEQLLEF